MLLCSHWLLLLMSPKLFFNSNELKFFCVSKMWNLHEFPNDSNWLRFCGSFLSETVRNLATMLTNLKHCKANNSAVISIYFIFIKSILNKTQAREAWIWRKKTQSLHGAQTRFYLLMQLDLKVWKIKTMMEHANKSGRLFWFECDYWRVRCAVQKEIAIPSKLLVVAAKICFCCRSRSAKKLACWVEGDVMVDWLFHIQWRSLHVR